MPALGVGAGLGLWLNIMSVKFVNSVGFCVAADITPLLIVIVLLSGLTPPMVLVVAVPKYAVL